MYRKHWNPVLLTVLTICFFAAACGGGGTTAQSGPPTQSLLSISGQYDLVLTSTTGRGTTNVYTNFTQDGSTFTGAANTLVCPSNDLSQCKGDDPPAVSIIPRGTVGNTNVIIVFSFPSAAGADTVTMVSFPNGSDLAGTFTDSLGDVGNWTAFHAVRPFGPLPFSYSYSGTFNSTSNPLLIPPSFLVDLGPDPNFKTSTILYGTAAITNSPCVSSLNFTGHAIGDAFSLTDAANKVSIIALPTLPRADSFTFGYKFDPTAANCAGDSGRGELTIISIWDY